MSETKVLVVANRTASTPAMLAEVHRRRETCSFGVMVPPEAESDWSADDRHGLTDRVQHLGVAVTLIPPELGQWARRGLPGRLDAQGDQPRGHRRVRQLLGEAAQCPDAGERWSGASSSRHR